MSGRILYQGLLRSPASWARVGRGYIAGLLSLGEDVAAVAPRGFRHDPSFALPAGLSELTPAEARALPSPDVGLGFLHPPHLSRLLGKRRVNLFVWESDVAPHEWIVPLAAQTDIVIVPSRFTKESLVRSGLRAEKVAVAPYGHDAGSDAPPCSLESTEAKRPRPFTFLTVAAPHWRKGVRELLLAYAQSFRAGDGAMLRIKTTYDPGSSRRRFPFEIPSWERLLESCGLSRPGSPPVEIDTRTLGDREVLDIYRSADLYVQASWGESFGLALFEAMALGLPAIATGWGGHLEYLSDAFRASSDLIPYRAEEGGERLYARVPGAMVAIPDVDALAERMRWHFEHRVASRELGLTARQAAIGLTWLEASRKLIRHIG